MAESPYVINVGAGNFESVVLDGSFDRPVLVDFWADWCAPCRMLTPVLEKIANDLAGKLVVAKINTEQEQALAAEFGIRSLPTVQLFKSGQPVDQFMGALPEAQVREFLDRHIPRASDGLLDRARGLMEAGDLASAEALIEQALAEDPGNARVALAQVQITAARGEIAEAESQLDRLPIELAHDPDVVALRGRLRFAAALEGAPPEAELAARLDADPSDSDSRYRMAAHQVVRGDYAAALENLFVLMKRDRAYGDDAGRKGMLAVFDLLGGEGDLVTRYRARMMTALY